MIDLTHEPQKKQEREASAGEIILTLMPFVIAMIALIERGLA